MEDLEKLSDQLDRLEVDHVVPKPARNFFPYSVIGGNPIGPNSTVSQAAPQEDKNKALVKSSRDSNPFYKPSLDLEAAAKYIHKILSVSLRGCESWVKTDAAKIRAALESTRKCGEHSTVTRMLLHLNHILFFLEHGRQGFDLTFLPDNFFADIEELLPKVLVRVEQLSELEGCALFHEAGAVTLRNVQAKLGFIKNLRNGIWLQFKGEYERQMLADAIASVQGAEDRVFKKAKMAKSRSTNGKTQIKPSPKVQLDLEVDIAFAEKQEFKAGGGPVSLKDAVAMGNQAIAPNQKAVVVMLGGEARHKAVQDTPEPAPVPSTATESALVVEEELEIECNHEVTLAHESPQEYEAINPEFALFEVDEEQLDVDASASNTQPNHEEGHETTDSEPAPSAASGHGLFVVEEPEVETGLDKYVADEMPPECEAINPEFALFEMDEEEVLEAGEEDTAKAAEQEAKEMESGLLALEADCDVDADGGTQHLS